MKTKEISVCRKCSGTGKPSKGYMNFHNIQTQDLSKEFETKLLDCIKCELCGHSWIPETSTREQASKWFANKSYLEQHDLSDKYFESRNPSLLTIEQVLDIYNKEVLEPKRQEEWQESQVNCRYTKPNAKEFKQFDESLFKSYIDKFSDEDKLKMWDWLTSELSNTVVKTRFEKMLKQLY